MPDPQIEKLLIVQDRDVALQKIEQDLARIPADRAGLKRQITLEEENIETARRDLQAKEVTRHDLDTEVKAKEAAVIRFRNQQLEVKKNDEYRALTHQIEQSEAEIANLEEKEIELMFAIDESRASFETEKARIEERIALQNREIARLGERETNLQASVDSARQTYEKARLDAEASYLEHYERVRRMVKRAPYVVPVEDHKCMGCHMRVSNEVASAARNAGKITLCDQCGRIVYA